MSEAATTKLSSKGQIVIPEEIRNPLRTNQRILGSPRF